MFSTRCLHTDSSLSIRRINLAVAKCTLIHRERRKKYGTCRRMGCITGDVPGKDGGPGKEMKTSCSLRAGRIDVVKARKLVYYIRGLTAAVCAQIRASVEKEVTRKGINVFVMRQIARVNDFSHNRKEALVVQ